MSTLLTASLLSFGATGQLGAAEGVLHPSLAGYAAARLKEIKSIPKDRRVNLDRLAAWIKKERAEKRPVRLTFICTHNSRRSHVAQLWAQAAARIQGVDGIESYSGGTEATAFNPRAVAAMKRAGFHIEPGSKSDNPRYQVSYGPQGPTMVAFSKVYGDKVNPTDGFAAVMTCSQADAECPFVPGAAYRVSVPYEDPKAFDGTSDEAKMYDARVRQISTEMLYLFAQVKE